jgi:hypothetical protein
MISGESYSISQKETPPSDSPTPDVMRELRRGETVRQVLQ